MATKVKTRRGPTIEDAALEAETVRRGQSWIDEAVSRLMDAQSTEINEAGAALDKLARIAVKTPAGRRVVYQLGRDCWNG